MTRLAAICFDVKIEDLVFEGFPASPVISLGQVLGKELVGAFFKRLLALFPAPLQAILPDASWRELGGFSQKVVPAETALIPEASL